MKRPVSRFHRFLWLNVLLGILAVGFDLPLLSGIAMADCQPQVGGVLMATPLSSRLDRIGDAIQGVLEHPLQLQPDLILPSGTLLKGKVLGVKRGDPRGGPPGKIQVQWFQASNPAIGYLQVNAMPVTEGGWLRQQDANTPVWQVALGHSTRMLNSKILRRLGTNQAVWASSLGISSNVIPDVTTDEFVEQYHRNNVMVGAGDRIYFRFLCPEH